MIKFICNDCKKVFEDTIYIAPCPFEKSYYPICPKCGSFNVEEY